MIPELAVAMWLCKMGAVHSVIFAGFSASAVTSRVNDCEEK
jgi:acetyl-CoA synthetase